MTGIAQRLIATFVVPERRLSARKKGVGAELVRVLGAIRPLPGGAVMIVSRHCSVRQM